jgi:hypothetical protein
MTRHPFDSGELGRDDPDLDLIGERLERYAADVGGEPSIGLVTRITTALDDEPVPTRGWWATLMATIAAWHGPARLALASVVVTAAVVGVITLRDLADGARNGNTGGTPLRSVSAPPSPSLTPSPTPSPTPRPTSTPTATPSPSPSPTASDGEDDETETPGPSESDDNSGPGGGDDDNSGPGGGD